LNDFLTAVFTFICMTVTLVVGLVVRLVKAKTDTNTVEVRALREEMKTKDATFKELLSDNRRNLHRRIDSVEDRVKEIDKDVKELTGKLSLLDTKVEVVKTILVLKHPSIAKKAEEKVNNH